MKRTPFGHADHDNEASRFTIAHSSGIRAAVTDLGATLVSLEVPDRSGRMGDVVLGFSYAEDYAAHAGYYFGSMVGRFGNRIAHGRFELDGRPYQLTTNDLPGGIPCHLHGGNVGFHQRLWSLEDAGEDYVRFGYCSPDGEEGYPGNLRATVTYRVGPERQLTWTAEAVYYHMGGELVAGSGFAPATFIVAMLMGHEFSYDQTRNDRASTGV
jgi:aldose 1-epimerase